MRIPFTASLLAGSLTLALSRRERGEAYLLYTSPLEGEVRVGGGRTHPLQSRPPVRTRNPGDSTGHASMFPPQPELPIPLDSRFRGHDKGDGNNEERPRRGIPPA